MTHRLGNDVTGHTVLRGFPGRGTLFTTQIVPTADNTGVVGSNTNRLAGMVAVNASINSLSMLGGVFRIGVGSITPTTGQTVTIGTAISLEQILGSATLGSLLINLPLPATNGQEVVIQSQVAITSLSVRDSTGSTTPVLNGPAALTAGQRFTCTWNVSASQWWCGT